MLQCLPEEIEFSENQLIATACICVIEYIQTLKPTLEPLQVWI